MADNLRLIRNVRADEGRYASSRIFREKFGSSSYRVIFIARNWKSYRNFIVLDPTKMYRTFTPSEVMEAPFAALVVVSYFGEST